MGKYHKPAFERTRPDKQERILEAAIAEFAAKGFEAANINRIAQRAGISIGAMYKYFGSKEDLYLTVIDRAYQLLEGVLADIERRPDDIFAKIERIVRAAQHYSRQYPELNQIYLDMTSQGLCHLSRKLSGKLETLSARLYRRLVRDGQARGQIDPALDVDVTAFCLDNLVLMLQYSYTSDYFRERLKVFAGVQALEDEDRIRRGVMRCIRGALQAPERRQPSR